MPPESKPKKRRYLPHGKPVRKGMYPLRPGVEGFFITCDGGRERQAAGEAVNLLDEFCEEFVDGKVSGSKCKIPEKPMNKITKFESSDSDNDDDSNPDGDNPSNGKQEDNEDASAEKRCTGSNGKEEKENEDISTNGRTEEQNEETPAKRQRTDSNPPESETVDKTEDKSINDLIQEELKELVDRKKRHFVNLDTGCNGVIFVQMNKRTGDPSPATIVENMLSFAATKRKHLSRFILRILPAEVTCYPSEEEITRAIKPLISEHFPSESSTPQKFAVLFEARANTGVDRMTIINAVAKSVPEPHKVDLGNPDKTIIVQIAKTVCMIGVAKRYKELSKYNLRQLTSPPS